MIGRRDACGLIAVLAVLVWAAPALGAPQPRGAVSETEPRVSFGTDGRPMVIWRRQAAGETRKSTILDEAGAPGPITDIDLEPVTEDRFRQFVTGPGGHRAFVTYSQNEIRIARLDDAGAVESVETVAYPGISDVRAAFDAAGRMTVTWETEPVWGESIVNAFRTDAQGEPGPIREVFPDRQTLDWSIAVDSQGRTAVARLATGRMELVTLDANGVPGPVTQLANHQAGFPTVAVDSQDRPTVVWEEGPAHDPQAVRMRRVETDGTLGPVHTLAEGRYLRLFGVDFDATGGGTVMLRLPSADFGGGSIGAVRIGLDGTPGPVRAVGPPTYLLRWGLDDLGRTRIAWEKERRIETVLLDPDGNPGGVRTITELGADPNQWSHGTTIDMAVDSPGRATVAWTESPAGGPNGSSGPIRAIRIAADGSFGQIHTLSQGDRSPPELTLVAPRKQQLAGSVNYTVSCDEFCRLSAGGSILVLRRSDGTWKPKARIPLRGFDDADNLCRPYGNQCAKDLRLPLQVPDLERAKRALNRGRWLIATVNVEAEDGAGLTDSATQEIRLKRRAPKARQPLRP